MFTHYNAEGIRIPEQSPAEPLKIIYRGFGAANYYKGSMEISKDEYVSIIKDNERAYSKFKSDKTNTVISTIIGYPSMFGLTYCLVRLANNNLENAGILLIPGVPLIIAATLEIIGIAGMKKSAVIYNTGLQSTSMNMQLQIGLTENGLGCILKF